ncbi:hypothetical protein [Nostoc sp. DedQUE07]|nr:hypothetical protein [Nostoc sp. DedQUE07]MDZ8129985.1 hypothetical protein [Nostoc sp. DedQUE07]
MNQATGHSLRIISKYAIAPAYAYMGIVADRVQESHKEMMIASPMTR